MGGCARGRGAYWPSRMSSSHCLRDRRRPPRARRQPLPLAVPRPPGAHGRNRARSREWRVSIRRCGWTCWPRAKRHNTKATGRNIFVSQRESRDTAPMAPAMTDADQGSAIRRRTPPPPPPIPLKFYGFANSPGEPKKIFLKLGEDVFVAGEGEIVDRRYKVIRISANSVDIQDVVGSGPPQNIPLSQARNFLGSAIAQLFFMLVRFQTRHGLPGAVSKDTFCSCCF